MKLKFMAISDTHLGEDCSLLSFPQGRWHLWDALNETFGNSNGDRFDVDELILIGDIPDRCLSSTAQVITHTNAFIRTLGNIANVNKCVYIPGNHDHTLWSEYREGFGDQNKSCITEPSGEYLVENGQPCVGSTTKSLLSLFFGYPNGSSWRAIETQLRSNQSFHFMIANPLYATSFKNKLYVFTHGTHFRKDVTTSVLGKKIVDYLQLDKLLGDVEIDSDCNITGHENLKELEKKITGFVDSIWRNSRNNPTPHSDQFWYLVNVLRGNFEDKRKIEGTEKFKLFSSDSSYTQFPKDVEGRVKYLTSDEMHGSLERWEKYFKQPMLDYLDRLISNGLISNELIFVYGDTHDGGWGELPVNYNNREIPTRIYNCGAWVTHNKDHHPPCHIFAVDEHGVEYVLDISYYDVKVDGMELIELAALDAENHIRGISRILRYLAKSIFG